jgi:hypothetical protein
MPKIDRSLAIRTDQAEIDAVSKEGNDLSAELSRAVRPTFLAEIADETRQKLNVQDVVRAVEEFRQFAKPNLQPEDAELLQKLSSALRAPEQVDALHEARARLQEAVEHLSSVKEPSQTASRVEWIEYRDSRVRLETLGAAAELARTAETSVRGLLQQRDALVKATESRIEAPLWPDLSSPEWMAKARDRLGNTDAKMYLDRTEVWGDPRYGTDLSGYPTYDGKRLQWCGAFVTWALREAGIGNLPDKPSEVKQWSIDWPQAGQVRVMDRPVFGGVAILGSRNEPEHMGFVAGRLGDGRIVILGGNQMRMNDNRFRGVTYYAEPPARISQYLTPSSYEPKVGDTKLPLMIERNGSLVYAADELLAIRDLSPGEALERLIDLIAKSGIDPAVLKADYERIWLEAGGKGEPPPLH